MRAHEFTNYQGVAEGEENPQSELKLINQKLKDAYKQVRNNSSVSIGWYMSQVKELKARREELIKQLKQGVAEGESNAMVNTASRLANKDDGKVAKLRAAGDKRREDQLKGRDIARRDRTSKDEWGYLKQDVAEGENNDTAISLSKLGKFHPGADTLAEFVPERATAQYALHPDKWESTFYSLTNKDSEKLKYYGPKKISIPPGTLVGDMAIANKFYRAKTPEEQEQYAELYKASLQPYPVDVSEYRMPELLIPKQGVAEAKMSAPGTPQWADAVAKAKTVKTTSTLWNTHQNVRNKHMAQLARDSGHTPTPEMIRSEKKGVAEARKNPDQNKKYGMGKYELAAFAEDIRDQENWGVSMTAEPKLGINPQVGISEDTPKGIYFYPLEYFIQMVNRYQPLPWGDNMPYMQLFQYDRSGEMTEETQVDPAQLRQALSQYCPDDVIQQVLDEPDQLYDGTPYWMIYDALSRLGKGDETNIVRWNKVLRDLGFTSVYDPGAGWIAYGEPTQGVVLDPRIIKQHKMFVNRNPKVKARQYDVQELADAIMYNGDYDRERQRQRIAYGDPAEVKARLDVAKSMLRPFLGKTEKQAKEIGLDQAIKTAGEKVIEILKQSAVQENFADGKNPGRKGLSKRVGIPKKATLGKLEKIASSSTGERRRMAQWQLNMRRGKKK